ncbi:SCO family protein [Massilia sp. PWRC2]|uniref:SCO family protein n=1 Tax=Massilia sp. PWRC2 TaxID=2804626 RepID=UPI003CE9573C
MRPVSPSRRRALLLAAALPLSSLVLTGCRKPALHFNGLDISGADDGRQLRLRDANGQQRSLADFKGKLVLLFFGFTQCPDVCPTALTRATDIKRLLGADGASLQVLFVTVDPERDTPAVLKAYTAAFDPGFLGLYGDAAQTAAAAKEFNIYFKKVPTGDSYTMDHTAISYVFDRSGALRLAWRHAQSAPACADDLRQRLHAA